MFFRSVGLTLFNFDLCTGYITFDSIEIDLEVTYIMQCSILNYFWLLVSGITRGKSSRVRLRLSLPQRLNSMFLLKILKTKNFFEKLWSMPLRLLVNTIFITYCSFWYKSRGTIKLNIASNLKNEMHSGNNNFR